MGYDLEVAMIATARRMELLTAAYSFNPEESRAMAEAGADVVVAHMGLTTKGSIGARTALTLDDCVARVQAIHDAAVAVNRETLVFCHGGPIAEPPDVTYILERVRGIAGFFGASSVERLPSEVAITEAVRRFKELPVGRTRAPDAP